MRFPSTLPPERPEMIAPGSPLYTMLSDATNLIYPLPALLLPLLHPATADSTARNDRALQGDAHVGHLLARIGETFTMVAGVVYGRDESDDAARAIRDLHKDLGGTIDGESYHPWSRDLWAWNWAAITAAVMDAHGAIRGWPSEAFRADCYLGMVEVGRRIGVRGMPESVRSFDVIWPVERDRIADTDSYAVRYVASTIFARHLMPPPRFRSAPPIVWAVISAPLRHLFRVSICAAVPTAHRSALGLPVGRRDDVYLALHRLLWRVVPRSLTHRLGVRHFDRLLTHTTPVWRTRFSPEAMRRHTTSAR